MQSYHTHQRTVLLDFLSQHPDEQFSARQIAQALTSEQISISAVYRNLAVQEKAGKVRRVSKTGSREVFYQFTDAVPCREALHLSCKKCGKTYHMNTAGAERLIQSVAQVENFQIDKAETVLYGICAACQKGKE